MTDRIEASVVIPARNAADTIGLQLAALERQRCDIPWEIVVVDNASSDATAAVVADWQCRVPFLRLVTADRRGTDIARNAGVRAARASKILLCDADDVVSENWVAAMVRALEDHEVVAGSMEYALLNDARARATRGPILSVELPSVMGHLPFGSTANLAFRRSVFDCVGGFDESMPSGADDIDFSWRAQYAGFSLGFVPDAVVHYRLRNTLRGMLRQSFSYARHYELLYTKHRNLGRVRQSPVTRWKSTAYLAVSTFSLVPSLASPELRWRFVNRAGRVAGSFVGLLAGAPARLTHRRTV